MYIIDTNILVSEILTKYEQDVITEKYRKFYQTIPLSERVIPDFVLNEFELYMMQIVPSRYKDQINEKEKRVLRETTTVYIERMVTECTVFGPNAATVKSAFHLYKTFVDSHYISFTDCLLLASAQSNGFELLTKDTRLNARAKVLGVGCAKV